jgi:hypothetical protein
VSLPLQRHTVAATVCEPVFFDQPGERMHG